MSTTPKKQSIDRPQIQSDVLSSLESIKTMFEACQSVLNTYTQATLMLSIITEAKMFQLKLQVMKGTTTCPSRKPAPSISTSGAAR